jgi:mono/diheme cytochrome c family protein
MTPRSSLALSSAVVLIVGAVVSIWFANRSVPAGVDDPTVIATGARVYAESCAACHGARLEGQPDWRSRNAAGRLPAPPHDASGHTWHHPTKTLFEITKYGVGRFVGPGYLSDMPAFEGRLSDHEIRAVLMYIRAQWPAEIRKVHDEVDRKSGP